jgi:hypothetical protein
MPYLSCENHRYLRVVFKINPTTNTVESVLVGAIGSLD